MKIVEQGNFTPVFLNIVSVFTVAVFAFLIYCDFGVFVNRVACMVLIVVCSAVGLCRQAMTCNIRVFRADCDVEWKIRKGSKD